MGVDCLAFERMYPRPERLVEPIHRLAVAVVHQAVDDLAAPQPLVRRSAVRFFRSDAFDTWCGLTPLNPAAVRARLVILRLVEGDDAHDP